MGKRRSPVIDGWLVGLRRRLMLKYIPLFNNPSLDFSLLFLLTPALFFLNHRRREGGGSSGCSCLFCDVYKIPHANPGPISLYSSYSSLVCIFTYPVPVNIAHVRRRRVFANNGIHNSGTQLSFFFLGIFSFQVSLVSSARDGHLSLHYVLGKKKTAANSTADVACALPLDVMCSVSFYFVIFHNNKSFPFELYHCRCLTHVKKWYHGTEQHAQKNGIFSTKATQSVANLLAHSPALLHGMMLGKESKYAPVKPIEWLSVFIKSTVDFHCDA